MQNRCWIVLLSLVCLGAGTAGAWQWSSPADPDGERYRFEAGFQPGYALSRRADQGTYWGDMGWRVSEHSVIGLNGGYFGPARDARQVNVVAPGVNTTTVQAGDNRFYYIGPFWRYLWNLAGVTPYFEAGAGPAVQQTRVINRTTDHLNGNSVQFLVNDTTDVNAALNLAVGVDLHVASHVMIGLGLRDLAVLRGSDPTGYPADEVRPLNSVIPYVSFRFCY